MSKPKITSASVEREGNLFDLRPGVGSYSVKLTCQFPGRPSKAEQLACAAEVTVCGSNSLMELAQAFRAMADWIELTAEELRQ